MGSAALLVVAAAVGVAAYRCGRSEVVFKVRPDCDHHVSLRRMHAWWIAAAGLAAGFTVGAFAVASVVAGRPNVRTVGVTLMLLLGVVAIGVVQGTCLAWARRWAMTGAKGAHDG